MHRLFPAAILAASLLTSTTDAHADWPRNCSSLQQPFNLICQQSKDDRQMLLDEINALRARIVVLESGQSSLIDWITDSFTPWKWGVDSRLTALEDDSVFDTDMVDTGMVDTDNGSGNTGDTLCYDDDDQDGFGDEDDNGTMLADCSSAGMVDNNDDCDDGDDNVNPDQLEQYDEGNCVDNIDNDCDGFNDENEPGTACQMFCFDDVDNDGFPDEFDNGIYRDTCRSTEIHVDLSDIQDDEWDCDDGDWFVNPSQFESCNGVDDDCDGRTDESACAQLTSITFDIDLNDSDIVAVQLFGMNTSHNIASPSSDSRWYGRGEMANDGIINASDIFLLDVGGLDGTESFSVTIDGDIDDEFWFNGFVFVDEGTSTGVYHIVDQHGVNDYISISVDESAFGIWSSSNESSLGSAETETDADGDTFTDYDDDGYHTDWDGTVGVAHPLRSAIVVTYDN